MELEVNDELKPMDTEDEEVAGYSGNLSPSFVTPTKSYHEEDEDEDEDEFQLQLSPGEDDEVDTAGISELSILDETSRASLSSLNFNSEKHNASMSVIGDDLHNLLTDTNDNQDSDVSPTKVKDGSFDLDRSENISGDSISLQTVGGDTQANTSGLAETETPKQPSLSLQEQLALLPECPSLSKEPFNVSLSNLNPYLTCPLCNGYLYEASTITECMHTFCKTCIVKYTERHLNCPTCDTPIHPTDPFVHIRNDSTIQDIVYKLLPHVAEAEIQREIDFYKKHEEETGEQIAPKLMLPPPPPTTPPPGERPPNISEILKQRKEEKDRMRSMAKEAGKNDMADTFKIRPGRKPADRVYKSHYVSVYLDFLYTEEASSVDDELLLDNKFVRVTGKATVANLMRFICKKLRLNKFYTVNIYYTDETHADLMELDVTLEDIRQKYYDGQDVIMELQYTFSAV